ncbi:MAG: PRC-barrel domain-containing protein [Chloroflexota bacterium]
MRYGKDFNKKLIISISDGRQIGQVKDLFLDDDLRMLTGIYVGSEGLIRRKSMLIPRESVVVFGIDAVLVKNAEVIKDSTELTESEQWVRLSKLKGRPIDTPGGTKIGTVGDIIIGEEGNITGLALSKVEVEGPIAEKGLVERSTLIDAGSVDGVITIDLTKAEMGSPSPEVTQTPPVEE